MDKNKILTPMNHREIDYIAQKLSGCNIPDAFSCAEILEWLDETGRRVFDDDLIMDYGTDCLRLYLMFEATPKANDSPLYESWHESALEGIYKFLARSRRLVLTAAYCNEYLGHSKEGSKNTVEISAETRSIYTAIDETRQKIEKYISRGNEFPNRHNIVSALMELQKTLQNKLKINEIIFGHKDSETSKDHPDIKINIDILDICREYIVMLAQFAPNISKVLWREIEL